MTPRPATVADIEGLWAAWCELTADGTAADGRYCRAPDAHRRMLPWIADMWLRHRPFPTCWVAGDPAVVGYIAGFAHEPLGVIDLPPTARISDLWVAPPARRRGLGRQLVGAFTEAAAAAGYRSVEVGTLTQDHRAVAFWRAVGFGDWQVVLRR